MIFLKTGLPGGGKTLHTIQQVMEFKAAADKAREADPSQPERTVYYFGIPELKIPNWIRIETMEELQKWYELPEFAIIVIDECQEIFRPRANGASVPLYISKFETHRHRTHDVFLITQHPMLIDQNIRRLAGNHMHVKRAFGSQSAVVHEWHSVKENCDKSTKDSIRHVWKYPKHIYGLYKSASGHTVKRNIPKKVIWLAILPLVLVGLVYLAFSSLGKVTEKGKQAAGQLPNASAPASLTTSQVQPKLTWLEEQTPRIDGLPHTAPVYDELTKAQQVPDPRACVQMGKTCKCYTNQATPINTPDDMCRQIVKNGIFLPHLPPSGANTSDQEALKRQYDAQQKQG